MSEHICTSCGLMTRSDYPMCFDCLDKRLKEVQTEARKHRARPRLYYAHQLPEGDRDYIPGGDRDYIDEP